MGDTLRSPSRSPCPSGNWKCLVFLKLANWHLALRLAGVKGSKKRKVGAHESWRVAHEFEREGALSPLHGLLFTGTGSWQTGANYPHQALKEGRKEGLFCICVGSRNLNLNWEL